MRAAALVRVDTKTNKVVGLNGDWAKAAISHGRRGVGVGVESGRRELFRAWMPRVGSWWQRLVRAFLGLRCGEIAFGGGVGVGDSVWISYYAGSTRRRTEWTEQWVGAGGDSIRCRA